MMNSWHIMKKFLKEEEIARYSTGCNSLSSKPQIRKIKEYHAKKKEASKEKDAVASTSKVQANQIYQEGKKNNKNNWSKTNSQVTGSQKSKMIPWTMS
ncbi:hypothetical protein O181_012603 [Austropuccinia psidii MF-1]|uniref:Uncharacterized protein n=1 Tax=Austropuccinia psidii MF-1 TaxID=1389203 RepID=A0A9Q3BXL9_9BASI|nr:hypothetical protein [Austropuccinia psidii MF-1]